MRFNADHLQNLKHSPKEENQKIRTVTAHNCCGVVALCKAVPHTLELSQDRGILAKEVLQRPPRTLYCSAHYLTSRNAGHRVQDAGHRTQGTEHRTQGTGHRTQDTRHTTQGTEQDTRHRIQDTEHRTHDAGHMIQDTGHRTGHRTQDSRRALAIVNELQAFSLFCWLFMLRRYRPCHKYFLSSILK